MTRLKDDDKTPPPGGRAAERLREFERARGIETTLKPEEPLPDKGEAESGDSSQDVPEKTERPKE